MGELFVLTVVIHEIGQNDKGKNFPVKHMKRIENKINLKKLHTQTFFVKGNLKLDPSESKFPKQLKTYKVIKKT